jgi:hypothetical protein
VRLSPRPAERGVINGFAYESKVQELLHRRGEEAEAFWRNSFARVVEGEQKTAGTN